MPRSASYSAVVERDQLNTTTKRSVWARALFVADQTPDSRNRLIDFLRVFSIIIVVYGHWLAAAPYQLNGQLTLSHVLDIGDSGIHYLTWILQIMPIFFMVGGYSNAKSLAAAQRNGTRRRTWLAARYVRLITPIVPFLIVWSLLVPILGNFVNLELLKLGSQVAAVPLWFLAVYLLAVALAPWTFRAWQRWRWKTLWVPALIATVFDVMRVNPDWGSWASYPSWSNYIWVWMTVHQIGYAWAERDRELNRNVGWLVAAGGMAGLIGLTVFGPFPVPLIGVEGEAFSNTTPPSIALFAQTLVQVGLISVMAEPIKRWLANRRVWAAVVLVSGMIMSVYVWHLTAMVVLIGVGAWTDVGFGLEPLSRSWWLSRPLWFALLTALLLVLVAIFGRYEQRTQTGELRPQPLALASGIVLSAVALAASAAFGIARVDDFPLRWWVPLALIAGTFLTGMSTFLPRKKESV